MGWRAAPLRHQPETVGRRQPAVHNGLPLRGGRVQVSERAAGLVRVSTEADNGVVGRGR